MGSTRPRKLSRGKCPMVVALAVALFLMVTVGRSLTQARGTDMLGGWHARDGSIDSSDGKGDQETQDAREPEGTGAAHTVSPGDRQPAAAATGGAARTGMLRAQDGMVASALAKVQAEADADPSLHWEANPAKARARAAALAEMMGIRASPGPPGLPRDPSLERARRSRDRVEALRGCRSLECVHEAHLRPRGNATFNFPHFLLVGWQKTATTSLFAHLNRHPQVNRPWEKEPEFFSAACGYQVPSGCPENSTTDYIKRVLRAPRYTGYDGSLACYEASTHYSRNGHLIAHDLAALMPWVKIVASLRDPISRAVSMLVHQADKNMTVEMPGGPRAGGCLADGGDLGHCLLTWSQIAGDDWGGPTNYSYPLRHWLEAFPGQVHLLQYENLTSSQHEAPALAELKTFLDLDPTLLESGLGMNNARRMLINPTGWRIKRGQYQRAIDLVRPDCEEVAALVERYGLGQGAEWMANWERIWRDNLNTCDDSGDCVIQLS